jgi:hypothetical protein
VELDNGSVERPGCVESVTDSGEPDGRDKLSAAGLHFGGLEYAVE